MLINSQDQILNTLAFKPYIDITERRVEPFEPAPHEPQELDILTRRGRKLTALKGYYLLSDVDEPDHVWPVEPDIFHKSYRITRPGFCVKIAPTNLVPLTELTQGDEDQLVTVQSLEGQETVRAGDYFLARGVHDEIWPLSKERVRKRMKPFQAE